MIDGRAGLQGFIHDRLQRDDFASIKSYVGGDDHLGFGIMNAAGESRGAEPRIDHAVDEADSGAGQHGNNLLGNLGEVDGDPIALCQAKFFQGVGAAIDLPVQLSVGKHAFLVIFTHPNQRDLVLAPGVDVAVQAIVGDVTGGADKPFGPGVVPIEDFGPGGEPLQLFGGVAPEFFRIGNGFFVLSLIVFDVGIRNGVRGRPVRPAFL